MSVISVVLGSLVSILTLYADNPEQSGSSAGLLTLTQPTASTSTTGWIQGLLGATQYSRPGQGRGAFFKPEQIANKRKSNAARQGGQDDDWFAGQYVEGWAYPGNRLPSFVGSHEATGHPAAFPVGLPAFFVRLFTDVGDVVYDPFLGSGSSLLAAHQEGRVGFGMELSPGYVDVSLARFQRVTNEKPVLESTGEPHDFLA